MYVSKYFILLEVIIFIVMIFIINIITVTIIFINFVIIIIDIITLLLIKLVRIKNNDSHQIHVLYCGHKFFCLCWFFFVCKKYLKNRAFK